MFCNLFVVYNSFYWYRKLNSLYCDENYKLLIYFDLGKEMKWVFNISMNRDYFIEIIN